MTIYAFDFDGTLTRRDTFLVFARFAKGTSRTFFAIMLMLPLLVMMKLRLYPNWRAKQQLFSLLFRGMPIRRNVPSIRCRESKFVTSQGLANDRTSHR